MLAVIIAAYIVMRARGTAAHEFTPFITVMGAVALLLSSRGRRTGCCGRRGVEAEA
jgi:hypothetical protein